MDIDPNSPSAAALGTSAAHTPDTDLDRDAFMRLLVTQIRNQDPMDPMDTKDLMSQLTELTSVEHLIGIEERLGTLQVANAGMANAQVASFVGHQVTADASVLRLDDLGEASGAFQLDADAVQVTATIRAPDGTVVRTLDLGEHLSGNHIYAWDGQTDEGVRAPAGRYSVELAATDAEGNPLEVDAKVEGTIQSVSYEHGYPELVVGEHRVLMGDVREIRR
ncbi:MAG: flagellar hook assembly protein FlgD [Sandaracinaceae bacterium]